MRRKGRLFPEGLTELTSLWESGSPPRGGKGLGSPRDIDGSLSHLNSYWSPRTGYLKSTGQTERAGGLTAQWGSQPITRGRSKGVDERWERVRTLKMLKSGA